MKSTWFAALLISFGALAHANGIKESEGTVKLEKVKVHTYDSSVRTNADGSVETEKSSLWTGERVTQVNDRCFHTVSRLLEMRKFAYREVSIDTPVVETKTVSVDCAAGKAGSLTWTGSLAN